MTEEKQLTPCPSCVKHQNKQSLDDVSADCFPCIWAHKKTGMWAHYEPVLSAGEIFEKYLKEESMKEQKKELELVPLDTLTKPLDVQVSGDHYKTKAIQPIEYIHANGLGFCEGNIVKYATRWRDKGGKQDLEKVKHYVDLLIQLEGL